MSKPHPEPPSSYVAAYDRHAEQIKQQNEIELLKMKVEGRKQAFELYLRQNAQTGPYTPDQILHFLEHGHLHA